MQYRQARAKITWVEKTGGVPQVTEYLSNKCEDLSSSPSVASPQMYFKYQSWLQQIKKNLKPHLKRFFFHVSKKLISESQGQP
jgi:heterodisulfide reductase subunit B